MTRMYIPQLRDKIRLTSDWTFMLYDERRNESLHDDQWREKARLYNTEMWQRRNDGDITHDQWYAQRMLSEPYTWPAGTVLSIDRIYIKNGLTDYNSVTFRLVDKKRKGIRFWAKLDDVNKLQFEPVEE